MQRGNSSESALTRSPLREADGGSQRRMTPGLLPPGHARRLLLLRDRDDDVGAAIAEGSAAAGWDVFNWPRARAAHLPEDIGRFHTVLGYGPHNGSMLPVAGLLTQARQPRPRFVWWLCENAPDPASWRSTLFAGSLVRWWGDRLIGYRDDTPVSSGLRQWLSAGQRHRILAELRHFRRAGLLDRLVVTSAARARLLQQLGFETVTIPLGYHAGAGDDLGLERDIDVLFLGRLTPRREAHLRTIRDALASDGINMEINASGGQWVEGHERTRLLNRAKIVLNLLRSPGDFTSHRLVLAMANKALVVSEPFADPSPYQEGTHFIQAASRDLPSAIGQLIRDDQRRASIVQCAYHFVTTELAMAKLCAQCLA